ncbi:uncharacterized protein RAG0_02029 [Rhynchosporium agropyri]|uniref:Uncharacterized protein n=1 Tax=Rhynchosporium agropyri TaxID=914238 RepID=A0A1E1K056_9HELO|nr:uncharacterized protein RAG0_02029 [Rhynchosporium agropyri]
MSGIDQHIDAQFITTFIRPPGHRRDLQDYMHVRGTSGCELKIKNPTHAELRPSGYLVFDKLRIQKVRHSHCRTAGSASDVELMRIGYADSSLE